jgi:hypothetical protein
MIKTPDGAPLEPRFDWYQATAKVGIRDVRAVLEPMNVIEPLRDESPKLKGYGWALKLGGPGGSLLIHYGGKNGDDHGPNIAGTGPLAPQVADLLRTAGVPHSVGRADVCLDFLADFDACRGAFVARCNDAGMASRDHGSCRESIKQLGRTVYGGSLASAYQPTLYEKGPQLGPDYPVDWLRLEHRFAFSKAHEKAQLATLSPMQMVGLRPVSRDLTMTIAELAAEPYQLTKYPKERSPYYWMLSQYQGVLRTMRDDHGSWCAVGEQIGLDLEEFAT